MRALKIYIEDTFVGTLTKESPTHYTFQYDDAYVMSDAQSLSPTLPKKQKKFESKYLFPFFSNTLPEGVNRRTICLRNHIDESDSFSLLAHFAGKETIIGITIKE